MAQITNVIIRFFSAINLTFRFAIYNLALHIPLFLLVTMFFHLKTENAVLCGVMYFGAFFTVAFLELDRGNLASHIVAGLAGVGAVVATTYCESDDSSIDFHHSINPANGLPMINDSVDIHGNAFGTNSMDDSWSSSSSSSSSMFDT